MSILMRFYDPCEGTITFDGFHTSSVKIAWLRSQIGYVLCYAHVANSFVYVGIDAIFMIYMLSLWLISISIIDV